MTESASKVDWSERCISIHHNQYEYLDFPIYPNGKSRLNVVCKKHGVFTPTLHAHVYRKTGCPVCASINRTTSKIKGIDALKQRAHTVHDNYYDYSLWISYEPSADSYAKELIPIVCRLHGVFKQSIANHLQGHGCPTCGQQNAHHKHRIKKDDLVLRAKAVHGDRYSYDKWEDVNNYTTDVVCITCSEHGDFFQTPASHINKHAGCPTCSTLSAKQTTRARYGCDHISQKHMPRETLLLLNDKSWLQDQHVVQKKTLEEISNELGVQDTTIGRYFKKHQLPVFRRPRSATERQIVDFLTAEGIQVVSNSRELIHPLELDIVLPDYNTAIECCGLYWHSELFKHRNYHLTKLNACRSKKIKLITLFEDEWINHSTIVKKEILTTLDCSPHVSDKTHTIDVVTNEQKLLFHNNNCIQRDIPSSISYGLFVETDMVAVMSFIETEPEIFTLSGYATSQPVNGGFKLLLDYFTVKHQWTTIIGVDDLRWSVAHLYLSAGFDEHCTLMPKHSWVVGKQRKSPNELPHQHLNQQLLKIWDCGSTIFVKSNNESHC